MCVIKFVTELLFFNSREFYGEVTHEFCLPDNLHTMLYAVAAVVHILQCYGNHIHVVVGIYTACDAKAQQVETAKAVLAGYWIAVGKDITDFAATDTGLKVKLNCKCLRGELLFWYVREHAVGIDEKRMSTHRTLVWDTELIQTGSQICT